MKLQGIKLELISITRQSLFDATYACACDNCGQTIINIATVQDTAGKRYEIGLDCKKKLIDKLKVDELLKDDLFGKSNAKEYKAQTSDAEKFLKLCAYPGVKVYQSGGDILIKDPNKPNKHFPDVMGDIIYLQSHGYLNRIGLKDFITQLLSK